MKKAERGKEPVRMAEVAEHAGVSRSTVSRALSHHPGIPEKTRKRVLESVEALGYRKHPMVSALMMQIKRKQLGRRQNTLGILNVKPEPSDWHKHAFYRRCMNGIQERAGELDFGLDEFYVDESGMTSQRLGVILTTRGIRGLLIPPLTRDRFPWAEEWEAFCTVAIGTMIAGPRLDRVCPDNFANMWQTMEEVSQLGYRRVGLAIFGPLDRFVGHAWTASYWAYYKHRMHEKGPEMLYQEEEPDAASLCNWIHGNNLECIICSQSRIHKLIGEAGLSVPGDIGLVDLNVNPDEDGTSGLDQQLEVVGARAVDQLVGKLHLDQPGGSGSPTVVQIQGRWREGRSTQRIHAST